MVARLAILILLGIAFPAQAQVESIYRRSIANVGDTTRLAKVFQRAQMGQPITLAVLGGSITKGYSASVPEKCWASLLRNDLAEHFPYSSVSLINTGIPSTESDLGSLRVYRMALQYKPHILVVEFAANDVNYLAKSPESIKEWMEGIVRQTWTANPGTAIVFLYTFYTDGRTAQPIHEIVGDYYDLPQISFYNAMYPEILAGRIPAERIFADTVHPNDNGHAWIASFLTQYFNQIAAGYDDLPPVPPALTANRYERVLLKTASETWTGIGWQPVPGWLDGNAWESIRAGDTLTVTVSGSELSLIYLVGNTNYGSLLIGVDGGAPRTINVNNPTTHNNSVVYRFATGLTPGSHTVTVTTAGETVKATILGIGGAGIADYRGFARRLLRYYR